MKRRRKAAPSAVVLVELDRDALLDAVRDGVREAVADSWPFPSLVLDAIYDAVRAQTPQDER